MPFLNPIFFMITAFHTMAINIFFFGNLFFENPPIYSVSIRMNTFLPQPKYFLCTPSHPGKLRSKALKAGPRPRPYSPWADWGPSRYAMALWGLCSSATIIEPSYRCTYRCWLDTDYTSGSLARPKCKKKPDAYLSTEVALARCMPLPCTCTYILSSSRPRIERNASE